MHEHDTRRAVASGGAVEPNKSSLWIEDFSSSKGLFSLNSVILIVVTCSCLSFSSPWNRLLHVMCKWYARRSQTPYWDWRVPFARFTLVSVSCERSFSALRRLKLWTRFTMTEERLSGLAMMLIHRGINYMSTPKDIYERNQAGEIFYRLVSQT